MFTPCCLFCLQPCYASRKDACAVWPMIKESFIFRFCSLLLAVPTLLCATSYPYEKEVEPNEREDIVFIVTTLATTHPLVLPTKSKELKAAGKRIEPIHTLRFLEVIFTDPELNTHIHTIRKKWVWRNFMNGVEKGFEQEMLHNGITQEQVEIFAQNVGVDPLLLYEPINQGQWEQFVEIVLQKTDTTPQNE